MNQKSIINQLELAYSPLTAYEFAMLKDDPLIEGALERASLYAITQRPVITFENVVPDKSEYNLNFEIHQKGNPEILKGRLPLIQSVVGSSDPDTIGIAFNLLNKEQTHSELPFTNIHGFSLFQQFEDSRKFLIWFSPEKLLQNWWRGDIECEVLGNFRTFLNYKIHYVGKATKQGILKRLKGHSTFQDILSLEAPVTDKDLPANEIAVLFFEFQNNLQFQTFGDNADIHEMVSALKGDNYPDQERIFLDAEKAIIKAIKPGYNKEMFHQYPKSKDGLYQANYDAISYTFMDPITLHYDQGQIIGGLSPFGGDAIRVSNNKDLHLIKHS